MKLYSGPPWKRHFADYYLIAICHPTALPGIPKLKAPPPGLGSSGTCAWYDLTLCPRPPVRRTSSYFLTGFLYPIVTS